MKDWDRVIMHIDMNAFFASVEQQANPELRGKPIAVTGTGRTVVTTASYEARAFGVKTGMNTWQARQACPQLIFVVGDNRKYADTSTRIVAMMGDYTPLVEVFSIDEAFLDVTGSLTLFGSAERIAFLLKARIRHEFGLTCSIGIAPNKLLAKLASEMKKPDGLTIIPPDQVATVLERMPAKELCGIGKNVEKQLASLGIMTCGQLGRFPVEVLKRRFGINGERLSQMGRGVDNSPVVPPEEEQAVKSVGHSMTLARDVTGREGLLKYLLQLAEMVGSRARRYGVAGKTVHLTLRYGDFTTVGRQQTRSSPTSQSEEIYRDALAILDTFDLTRPVRLLGVRVTNLTHHADQLPLFEKERKAALATAAMDEVNRRFGEFTVTYGSVLETEEKGSHVISPAWRPDGIRRVDVK
ncbi:MAG: DNA polymerase IV [Desulfuromonadales bacterium]|nr:DNA polymerase IV [Desulfuromonadales bacterium]